MATNTQLAPDGTPLAVVFDVDSEETFQRQVLERSHQQPVLVDFWAPWCGPCRVIGPVLEKMANAADGAWALAKLDVDQVQSLAMQYEVTSIPAVKAFVNGEVIDEFTGAMGEAQIEMWFDQWLPGPAEEAIEAGRAHEADKAYDDAKRAYETALEHKPLFPPAIVGLARVALATDARDVAQQHLQSLVHAAIEPDLEQEIAQMQLQLSQEGDGDLAALQSQVEQEPENLELWLQLGRAYAAAQQHEDAFQSFLKVIEQTRTGPGEKAKEAMVQLFAVVGMHSELATRYRSALSKLLFS